MPIKSIPGTEAWRAAARDRRTHWRQSPSDYEGRTHPVAYSAKFAISESDKFFCVGSCFARNIEEQIVYRVVNVFSLGLFNPAPEWLGRPVGILNEFTTHSMMNEVLWAECDAGYDESFFCEDQDGWRDLQTCPGATPVTFERALERRRYFSRDYFSRIREADVIVLTLGLNEVCHDGSTGLYLNSPPPRSVTARQVGRYSSLVTSVEENVQALTTIREAVLRLRPGARFLITVSPVPLQVTFTGEDAAIANTRSKSVLRAAADIMASAHEDVYYFPSYEMISLEPRALAYGGDCLHVADGAVGEVIAAFLAAHGLAAERTEPAFTEVTYCAANPDVDEAVRRGEFATGFAHWMLYGRDEGRPLTPAEGPTHIMRLFGIN